VNAAWAPRHPAGALQLAAAGAALALGLLVYLADRPAGHAMLLPAALALGTGPLFGIVGQWLPSFVHPFAFSLASAAARAPAAGPAYGACAGWWAVNVVFEAAQHPRIRPAAIEAVAGLFGGGWPTRPLVDYLRQGTLDPGDLIAATLGALAAAALLRVVHRRSQNHGQ
jgi:hypothetical protein